MLSIYAQYLGLLLVVFVGILFVKFRSSAGASSDVSPTFRSFQREFIAVYLIMMAADWMQGPYVYRLYSYYGFTRHENGILFIAGFGSSLIFGTWAGPMADKYGRKLNCILYGITYILSCLTKHFPIFWVLMIGRLLGGFATSILWSAFESWMVSEHNHRGFDPALIGNTFSHMITLNGIVAIISGFIAQWSVDTFDHPVAPFDVSALFLVFGIAFIYYSWSENYGDQGASMMSQMTEAITRIKEDKKIIFVGLQQSLFEGAMYTFVFMWTPTLETPLTPQIPHGLIFACFMVACSLGGSLFGYIEAFIDAQNLMKYVFGVASACMAVPMMTTEPTYIMGSFVVFEVMVGLFWPGIGTLRSRYLPESCRATVINLFRVPLNFMVCCVLYYQGSMTIGSVFTICTLFHAAALLCALALGSPQKKAVDLDGTSA